MGVLYAQASFKNSRINTRRATTHAHTIDVLILPGNYQMILAADPTRTYTTIFNTSTTGDECRYSYGNIGAAIVPDGMPLKAFMAADLESLQDLWVKNVGVNPVNIQIDYGQG